MKDIVYCLWALAVLAYVGFCLSLLCLIGSPAHGAELRLLDVDRVQLDGWRQGDNRSANLPEPEGEYWVGGASMTVNFTVLALSDYRLYADTTTFLRGTNSQVRDAGLTYETGLDFADRVKLWARHLSEHALDYDPGVKYQLRNEFGASLVLYKRGR